MNTDLVMPVMDGFKAVKAIRLFDRELRIIYRLSEKWHQLIMALAGICVELDKTATTMPFLWLFLCSMFLAL